MRRGGVTVACDKAPFKKGNPGNPCCGCEQLDQTFDSDNWTADYDTTGTWTRNVSGEYISTASTDATLISKLNYSATAIRVTLEPRIGDDSATTTDIAFRYTDADNYLCLRLAFVGGVATIRFYSRLGGAETAISDAVEFDPDGLFNAREYVICWRLENNEYYGENLVVTAWATEPVSFPLPDGDINYYMVEGTVAAQDIATLGTKHGVIVNGSFAGGEELRVTAVVVVRQTDDCVHCGCDYCENWTAPDTLTVTLSYVESPAACCTSLNATYTLTKGRNLDGSANVNGCYYSGPIDPTCETWNEVQVGLNSGTQTVAVAFMRTTTIPPAYTERDFARGSASLGEGPIDCEMLLDGLAIEPILWTRKDLLDTGCVFHKQDTITATDIANNSFTVASDWSSLTAGRKFAIINLGVVVTSYTVVSVSGSGPTTVFVAEDVTTDKTGSTAAVGARAVISVP